MWQIGGHKILSVNIEKRYQGDVPINLEKMLEKLLAKVHREHLIGLDKIIIVNRVTHKRDQKAGGLYWQKKGRELAKIEIAIDTIYKNMPKFVFFLPFITKFILDSVLYHEIGHHYQYSIHGVKKEEMESFAEEYCNKILKKTFLVWRIFLLPFSPLVRWLNKMLNEHERNKSY